MQFDQNVLGHILDSQGCNLSWHADNRDSDQTMRMHGVIQSSLGYMLEGTFSHVAAQIILQ